MARMAPRSSDGVSGFGEILKRYRLAAGLTQEALAECAGMSRRGISDLERGESRAPRRDTVALLVHALRLSPRERAAFELAARRSSAVGAPVAAVRFPVDGSTSPFVGRAHDLAALERHLAGAGPPLLLLAGEPGIGKTRLLREAAHRAGGGGWRVLEGECQRRGGQQPYAPVLNALNSYIEKRPAPQLRADLAGCAWLVRLLPELADGPIAPLPRWTLPPEQERRLMQEAVARFVANVAGPAGTLLVLDDLQWAGSDALDLLATLARGAAEKRVRIVGAYRDSEVEPRDPLAILLADLAHAGLAAQRALGPLAPDEAAALLAGVLAGRAGDGPELRERLLQRAGGLPFFLVSCAQALTENGRTGVLVDAIPWTVIQSIQQRMATLPETAQEVLGTAAVIGRVVARTILQAAVALDDYEMLRAVEAACRARLLIEEGPQAYHFAHDVIREVVEADLGAARRAVVHRHVAASLERELGPPPVELLAYHHMHGGNVSRAAPYLVQAGDRARRQNANAAAEGFYRDLIECQDALGHDQGAAEAREKLGAVLYTTARYDAALDVLDHAIGAYHAAGDLTGVGRVAAQIGHVHAERGTPDAGLTHLRPLLATLEGTSPTHEVATLYSAMAHLFFVSGRYAEQLAAAERAAFLARGAGNAWVLSEAENLRGLALITLGRPEEALPVLTETIQVAQAADNLESLSWALNNTASVYHVKGEFDTARRYIARAIAVAERRGDPETCVFQTYYHGLMSFFSGDWGAARRDMEQAASLSQQIGPSWACAYPLYGRGLLCLLTGDWEEGAYYLEDCTVMAARSGDKVYLQAQGLLAWHDLLAGCPTEALARLSPLRGAFAQGVEGAGLLALLAWAYLESGDLDAATAVVDQACGQARTQQHRLSLVDALWVQALVALQQEHGGEVEHALEEGLCLARSMPYPYGEARLLQVYGDLHVQRGERPAARERLEAALAIFQRLGARKDAERAKQGLSRAPE